MNLTNVHDWRLRLLFCCVRLPLAKRFRFGIFILFFILFLLFLFPCAVEGGLGGLPWVRVRRTGERGSCGWDAGMALGKTREGQVMVREQGRAKQTEEMKEIGALRSIYSMPCLCST